MRGTAFGVFSSELPRIAVASGPATLDIQLTPANDFAPSDGREMQVDRWRINAAIAARVIERYHSRKNRPVVDYEHQTLKAEDNGHPAPAAGWIAALEWREGSGLWARTEFTERATRHIAAKEYRYVSPVFRYDAKTGEILEVMMAAITNAPAIDGMAPMELQAAASFAFDQERNIVDRSHHGLTAAELAVCNSTGISPGDFAATKAQQAGPHTHGLSADELAICRSTGTDPAVFAAAKQSPPASKLTEQERAICRATGISEAAFLAARR